MMVSTDPIADMLSRIRNAIAVHKNTVSLPHSKAKEAIANLLKENGYVWSVTTEDAPVGKTLVITINEHQAAATITEIKRLSTPGRRLYSAVDNIPKVKQGRGIVILSTSKGMMTDKQAKAQNIGGELICSVY